MITSPDAMDGGIVGSSPRGVLISHKEAVLDRLATRNSSEPVADGCEVLYQFHPSFPYSNGKEGLIQELDKVHVPV